MLSRKEIILQLLVKINKQRKQISISDFAYSGGVVHEQHYPIRVRHKSGMLSAVFVGNGVRRNYSLRDSVD